MRLVLNCGSSSLKYRVFGDDGAAAGGGLVERIGQAGGPDDHRAALAHLFEQPELAPGDVTAVGHRVVHGGQRFTGPTRIDDDVVRELRALIPLAPLHNPAAIAGIEAARDHLPRADHVAVFDTAFHATLPPAAASYAIDADVARRYGIHRYGFHGISHAYVAGRTAELLDRPLSELNLVTLHLGNGASATAVRSGRSVETSMGFTPLEGLVMGSRSGDLDPAVPGHLLRAGWAAADVDDLLQHRSGLLGLSGSADLRDVLRRSDAGDAAAALALDVYCHRIRKYVGAYHAVLGRLDAITFTAGVGEHSPAVRAGALDGLDGWGILVDPDRNQTGEGSRLISPDGAAVAVCVVPTDEERAIADALTPLLGPAGRS